MATARSTPGRDQRLLAGYASRPAEPASGVPSRRSRRSSRRPVLKHCATGLRTVTDGPGAAGT